MKSLRLALIAVVSLFTLFACSKEETQLVSSSTGNTLLSYVPVASPYLAANLEPTPNEVIDSFLQKAAPVLLTLQSELIKVKAELESGPDAADTGNKLLLSLLQELDGKINRPGFESFGFDLQSHKVFYGMGAFPVARIGLSDGSALKATIQRILQRAGIDAPELDFQGQAYWRLAEDKLPDHHSEFPGGLYIAILEDHFAFSIFPTTAENELLPLFLGLQKPGDSDAAARLAAINAQYKFKQYFTGLLDLQLMANEFLRPDSLFASTMSKAGDYPLATLSNECRDEFREIIGHTPRLVAGTTELTPNAMGVSYVVETQPDLAQQLIGLVADIPLADAVSSRIVEFSFGLKFGPVRDFLREKIVAITQAPYQCEKLQALNFSAGEALTQLDQPMPPFVNNFQGLRVSMSKLGTSQSFPSESEGLVAIHVAQPEMFVGMAQMFLPGLSELKLTKGSPPVQLPSNIIPIPDLVAFTAISDEAIGVSVGSGAENSLLPYLQLKPVNDGTFMSLNYDTAAYLDYTQSISDQWLDQSDYADQSEDMDDEEGSSSRDAEHVEMAKEVFTAVQQAYKASAHRSQLSLRFTEHGFIIDSRMTFK